MPNNVENLLDKATEAIRRDLNHIFASVSNGKLDPDSSRDLVHYFKLLSSMQKDQEEKGEELAKVSEEDLKKLAKELIK